MSVMIHEPAEREALRVQANREELVERIERALRADGTIRPLQGCTWLASLCLSSRFTVCLNRQMSRDRPG